MPKPIQSKKPVAKVPVKKPLPRKPTLKYPNVSLARHQSLRVQLASVLQALNRYKEDTEPLFGEFPTFELETARESIAGVLSSHDDRAKKDYPDYKPQYTVKQILGEE